MTDKIDTSADAVSARYNPTLLRQPKGSLSYNTHKITFNTIDGVPDCSSIKMEKV